jgi:hypothetical protein
MLKFIASLMLITAASAASLDGKPVTITNASEAVLCAEKDNVTLNFTAPDVTSFRIEAVHPAYIGGLKVDKWAPDWTACEMKTEALAQPMPKRLTLYEDVEWQVVGNEFANFWRPSDVVFKIGEKRFKNIHLVQLWKRHTERAEEVLVVYPQDGYWRARPLPPEHLGWSAYGSSFLLGPIEVEGRPIVKLKEIEYAPATKTFTLTYQDGTTATVKIADLTRERQALDIAFSKPIAGKSFAALRSMYITRTNNDTSEVAVLEKGAKGWLESPIMGYKGSKQATDIWVGRAFPSKHNTSSPDMVFSNFK